jgi:pimeloyl-ACP methyl ester carboxylesterase
VNSAAPRPEEGTEPERRQSEVLGTVTTWWRYPARDADAVREPLLMVHGFRGTHQGLDDLARALSAGPGGRDVIVPDLPGFGQSPSLRAGGTIEAYALWLIALRDQLDLEDTPVLGHSFGTTIIGAALSLGMLTDRIVLINPISAPALQGPRRVGTLAALAYSQLAAALPDAAARRVLSSRAVVRVMSEVMAKTRDRALRRWIHRQHRAWFSVFDSPKTLLEAFEASITHDVGEYTFDFTEPTLVIAGDRDDIVPLSAQQAFVDELDDATLVVAHGVGHLVHYEAWRAADRWIRRYLDEGEHRGPARDAREPAGGQGTGR